MFCPKCGAPNPDDAKFCGSCGQTMQQQNASVPVYAASSVGTVAQPGMGNAPIQAVANAASSAAAKKSKKVLVIIGAVVVILLAAIAVGLVCCLGGTGIKTGVYSIKIGTGTPQSCVVNKDGTVGFTYNGDAYICSCEKSGRQGNSNVFDLKIKTINDKEVKYNDQGFITNTNELNGYYSSNYVKEVFQVMIPDGGTTGNVVGDWGFSYTYQIAGQAPTFRVMYIQVKENGTFQRYYDSGEDFKVPGMNAQDMIMNSGSSTSGYWKEATDNVYTLSDEVNPDEYDIVTVSMPS